MRITQYNLKEYLKETYGSASEPSSQKQLDNFVPLLQKDYGEANDCTLTSMTAIIFYLTQQKQDIKTIYSYVEKTAKKYGYRGQRGTPSITIRKIFHIALNHFGLPQAYVKYMKNLGFTFKNIKTEINKGNPIILSMADDGKGYYENHSITIIGYQIYKINKKEIPMLVVFDNWYKSISYVDYNKMSLVSSIHYSGLTFKQRHDLWKQLKNLK